MLGVPTAGTYVTENTALGVAAVWACTTLLADAVSTLPLRQYRGRGDTLKEVTPSQVVTQPFAEMTLQDFISTAMMSLTLRGNAYGRVIERDEAFFPSQIMPYHPDKVRVRRNGQGQLEYRMDQELVPIDDVIHIPLFRMPGELVGKNPIEVLRNTFGLARAADMYGGAFFSNSANPSGILHTTEDLSEEETKALKEAWAQAHQGIGQAQLPAVLTGGLEWQQISITPEDAQFIATRGFSKQEIAMIYRVPPHMISDVDRTTSWGTGIEEQELGFVRVTLAGYLKRFETAFTNMVPPGQFVQFDLSHRLRPDTLQRFQGYTLASNGGWYTVNDILRKEGMPTIGPAGDVHRVMNNMMDLKDLVGAGLMPNVNNPNPNSPNPANPSDVAPPGKPEKKTRVVERDERGRILRIVDQDSFVTGIEEVV